ncbi:hypothetical protein EDD86DRAFT_248443 [Gorgonomyces haynaldii]|nr:hypothetical protein EDD86DRAFT_248443 [Gorgonomyces haynaldii]
MALFKTHLGDILAQKQKKQPLVQLKHDATLYEAMNLMQNHCVTTLACYGPPGHFVTSADASLTTHNGKQYVAIVTLLDCVVHLLHHHGPKFLDAEHIPVFKVIGGTQEGRTLWIFKPETQLSTATEAFSKGLHSLFVANADPATPLGLLSQTDALWFVLKHLPPELQRKLEFPIGSYLPGRPVVSITGDMHVQQVLKMMGEKGYKSLPVVDGNGVLVDVFSISDLRIFFWDASLHSKLSAVFELLLPMTIEQFLRNVRQGRRVIVGAKQSDAVLSAMKFALEHHVHHVWIVDESLKPVDVLSYSDLLKIALQAGL